MSVMRQYVMYVSSCSLRQETSLSSPHRHAFVRMSPSGSDLSLLEVLCGSMWYKSWRLVSDQMPERQDDADLTCELTLAGACVHIFSHASMPPLRAC